MPVSLIDGESLLALDVGSVNTRAMLFDVVDGQYRFVAAGQSTSTAEAPFTDIGEGVRQAVENLQKVTGRVFLTADGNPITPSQPDGSGVDALAAVLSAGPVLKTVIAGLLEDVSLESARRLAETTYARVIDAISIGDGRKAQDQLNDLARSRPDLVIIAGGTDGGASRSMRKVIEIIGLVCYLLPEEQRPAVLFAGNHSLVKDVRTSLEKLTSILRFSPNVRPGLETEDIDPASRELAEMFSLIRQAGLQGVEELNLRCGGILPAAYAQGRMIRFLSQVYGGEKGLLGVDLGASAATVSVGLGGKLRSMVYPQFGLGEDLPNILKHTELADIVRWLPLDISSGFLLDYIHQKALYPASLPATKEELVVEQSLARQALYLAIQDAVRKLPAGVRRAHPGLLPAFEPIMAGGGVITGAPTLGQSLLLLLDALQPVGVTNIILDQNNLLPVLGAASARNNLLPVQVLESGAFVNLAAVVSPICSADYGTVVMRVRLVQDNGAESQHDIKYGSLEILPLAGGQSAKLQIKPLHRADVGFGPGRGGTIRVAGGVLGVVIDARGRPLSLPPDPVRRRDLIKKWYWTVGG
jgi:hypothetical protein